MEMVKNKERILKVGQQDEHGNEIIAVNPKTVEIACSKRYHKGMSISDIQGFLYINPNDMRIVIRQPIEKARERYWITPANATPTQRPLRANETQRKLYERVREAKEKGISTTKLTDNECKICRTFVRHGLMNRVRSTALNGHNFVFTVDADAKPLLLKD